MPKLSGLVRTAHNGDGAVILDILHGRMYRLNFVGSRIVELLKLGHSETQITEQISREFGASREIVATDLREFLSHLERHLLIEVGPAEFYPPDCVGR